MTTAPRPQVTPLEEGTVFETKQMEATEGVQWPRHKASKESVLVVIEGGLIVEYADSQPQLSAGDTIVIPADVWHEIVPSPAFKAIHIMPKGIRFTFSR
jgi:quercetin dioxygenase-like cupin family protein